MGKTLLDLLKVMKPQAQVYCINRGKIYWYVNFYIGIMKQGSSINMSIM